jgi:hypothetical protein
MSVEKVANAYAAAFELNELDRVRVEYGGEQGLPPGFAEALLAQEKRAAAAPGFLRQGLHALGSGVGEAVAKGGRAIVGATERGGTARGAGQYLRGIGHSMMKNPGATGAGALGVAGVGTMGAGALADRTLSR